MFRVTTFTSALAATLAASGAVVANAPLAAAEDAAANPLGSQAKLIDGDVVQGWTISNLKTTTDEIPYPVQGTLWEATATDEALQGTATPIVSNFNARSRSGQTYRALFQVPTPQGVNPSTLAPGEKSTGKIYFDVTGDSPESVVYNAAGQDLLTWVQPPPAAPAPRPRANPQTYGGSPQSARTATPPAAAEAPAAASPAPGTAPTAPAPAMLPSGSQGTPLPQGSQGTPLPQGSQGTPLPQGSQGTPLPQGSQGTPISEGSQGTPLPADSPVLPATAPPDEAAASGSEPATPVSPMVPVPAP